ncbi:hypothetical protein BGY98DRAFT_1002539 [Russula aff. rugulosa BPL654]|nr:hypothetical protein BGY98DRAFT_1002539 [Russula aff. rugulosa BPL654]
MVLPVCGKRNVTIYCVRVGTICLGTPMGAPTICSSTLLTSTPIPLPSCTGTSLSL